MKTGNLKIISTALGALMFIFSIDTFALDCDNPPGGLDPASAQANYQCAEKDRHAADLKLNQAYKKLLSDIKSSRDSGSDIKAQLIAAQKSWITFRDSECDLRTGISGGALQWLTVNHSECLKELTDERTKTLQGYDQDLSGQ